MNDRKTDSIWLSLITDPTLLILDAFNYMAVSSSYNFLQPPVAYQPSMAGYGNGLAAWIRVFSVGLRYTTLTFD